MDDSTPGGWGCRDMGSYQPLLKCEKVDGVLNWKIVAEGRASICSQWLGTDLDIISRGSGSIISYDLRRVDHQLDLLYGEDKSPILGCTITATSCRTPHRGQILRLTSAAPLVARRHILLVNLVDITPSKNWL